MTRKALNCMTSTEAARSVLACVGGRNNILSNSLCMTRLRLRLADPKTVDSNALEAIPGVLGLATRGSDGLEVVFGPLLVQDVYAAFVKLTGLNPEEAEVAQGTSPLSRSLRVQISPSRVRSYQAQSSALGHEVPLDPNPAGTGDDPVDDLAGLNKLFEQEAAQDMGLDEDEGQHDGQDALRDDAGPQLLVINGPNINMLGIREPELYGTQTYDDLLVLCKQAAHDAGFSECACFQSNHEGDIVDHIQDAYQVYDGIVINPGAFTHTSIAILDALKAVRIPAIEVHISKIDTRENFRQLSYVRSACFETIVGMGIEGYRKAINDMADHLSSL
jgi:3-dehydroquinate dehydratase-2